MPKTKTKNKKAIIAVGLIITSLFLVYFLAFSPFSPFAPTSEPALTPTTKATSTFTLLDYASGEDVSDWVEVSIWLPENDDADLFDDDSDPYRISNFDEDIDSDAAADVAVDLRSHAYAWIEIDPDDESDFGGYDAAIGGIISDDYRMLVGGANYDYTIFVYHAPTNVSVSVITREANDGGQHSYSAGCLVEGLSEIGSQWNGFSCANITVLLDAPIHSTNALHAGEASNEEWEIDNDDLEEILANDAELAWLTDQRNWRTIAPMYDIANDLEKEYDDFFTRNTNCFVVRIRANATISEVDGNGAEVNATLMERNFDEYDIEILYSNDSIYCVFTSPITWENPGIPISFDLELTMGTDINFTHYVSNAPTVSYMGVYTGRLAIPYDSSPLSTFTALARAPSNMTF